MGQPYIGEIRMAGFNFAPVDWAFCNGQLIAISQNPALFQLIGTTYGGDGVNTFALPDLQCRVPIHQGPGFVIGQKAGSETVTLTTAQLPIHNHVPVANGAASGSDPTNMVYAASGGGKTWYGTAAPSVAMNSGVIANAGGNQPHDNMQPYLVVNFVIALFGIFPTQN